MPFLRFTLLTLLVACSGCHGQMMSTAPPGSNLWLSCPTGKEINIVSMMASQKGLEDISSFCQSIPNKNCLHGHFLSWAKSVCDKLPSCRLPKPDSKMFVCNHESAISAIYNCVDRIPGTRYAIACDGEVLSLTCQKGTIRTIKANYGRLDQHLCSSKPSIMTFCMAPEFPSSVERLCQGSVACSVTINPKIMPRTVYCDNNPKYAYVSYVCEQR